MFVTFEKITMLWMAKPSCKKNTWTMSFSGFGNIYEFRIWFRIIRNSTKNDKFKFEAEFGLYIRIWVGSTVELSYKRPFYEHFLSNNDFNIVEFD